MTDDPSIVLQTIYALLAVGGVVCATLAPFGFWQFICYCDRIGREASAPLVRAFYLSLLAALALLVLVRWLTGCCR